MKAKEQKKGFDLIEFLKAKKAKDGKLNRLGEWMLSREGQEKEWEISDMKAVLK